MEINFDEGALAKVRGETLEKLGEGKQFLGTAFFISPWVLLTCKHVVEGLAPGKPLYLDLFAGHEDVVVGSRELHPRLDVAVLRLNVAPKFSFEAVRLSSLERQDMPESGAVWAVGFRDDTEKCTHRKMDLSVFSETFEKLTVENDVAKGNSGGPLFDACGRCLGLTVARSSGTACSYAIPVHEFRSWLTGNEVAFNAPTLNNWQRSYLKNVVKEKQDLSSNEFVQYLSGDHGQLQKKISLRKVYAPLHVDRPAQAKERDTQEIAQGEIEAYSALRGFSEQAFCVLKGDPGSGKTTFTRYWALRFAQALLAQHSVNEVEDGEEALPEAFAYAFPIHIELSKLYKYLPKDEIDQYGFSPGLISDAVNRYFRQHFKSLDNLAKLEESASQHFTFIWLLDGLDEIRIDDTTRQEFLSSLNTWAGQLEPENRHRVCLSSRPYAYENGKMENFAEFNVQPLRDNTCFQYIEKLFSQLNEAANPSPFQAEALIALLRGDDRKSLFELCRNPLLLSLTATLYYDRGKDALPSDRAGLYELCVEKILQRWEDKLKQSDTQQCTMFGSQRVSRVTVHQALNKLAYFAHFELASADDAQREAGDVNQSLLQAHFFPWFKQDINEQQVKNYLYEHTGILVDRDGSHYGFVHRSLREYLAARYLAMNSEIPVLKAFVEAFHHDPGWWLEVLALGAKYSDKQQAQGEVILGANHLLQLCFPYGVGEVEAEDYAAFIHRLFACAYAEQERFVKQQPVPLQDTRQRQRLRRWLLAVMEDKHSSIENKAAAGRHLGWLGDTRPGVGLIKPGKAALPDIQWQEIPQGSVTLEGTKKTFEIPQPFKLAKYPITHQQFQAFLDHPEGYKDPRWWQGFEQRDALLEERLTATGHARWQEPNHPRIDVSWYEASAFCLWLRATVSTAS